MLKGDYTNFSKLSESKHPKQTCVIYCRWFSFQVNQAFQGRKTFDTDTVPNWLILMYQSAVCALVWKQINCILIDEFTKHKTFIITFENYKRCMLLQFNAIAFEMSVEKKKESVWHEAHWRMRSQEIDYWFIDQFSQRYFGAFKYSSEVGRFLLFVNSQFLMIPFSLWVLTARESIEFLSFHISTLLDPCNFWKWKKLITGFIRMRRTDSQIA